ncbi:MAG: multicopper oxidase domain-containing protein [Rhodopseudomonas sp.]|nr:multicopper oxidase domain-containing protein [Rhodopseudomonas sp.]
MIVAVGAALFLGIIVTSHTACAAGKTRTYYIAAEEVTWDYAPAGRDLMMGMGFNDAAKVFVARGPDRIGSKYKKAIYAEYTDGTFTKRKVRPAASQYLGLLGPVIHAEVGDTIRVVFRNNASRPYSIHPHGVFYTKANEGAPTNDGTSGADRADDAVAAGATYTYEWRVPPRAGPGPSDPSSVVWPYHSHVNSVRDTNSGLVGAIIVTRVGKARVDGSPADVDREFVTLFNIFDENQSWYLDDNTAELPADPASFDRKNTDFIESNHMHAINGYLFGNMPMPETKVGKHVRWYLIGLGTEADLHTPHWHGNTVLVGGHREDTVSLLPATTVVADMVPDDPGIWMFHCHVNDHIVGGMTARYDVQP